MGRIIAVEVAPISTVVGGLDQATADARYVAKPEGRIDARVRGLSTADSGTANGTLLQTLLNESGTTGAELWIPDGTYRTANVNVPANARVNGTGTLKPVAGGTGYAILNATGPNTETRGITIDAENTARGISFDNEYSTAGDKHLVEGATIRNITDTEAAVKSGMADDVTVRFCTFEDVYQAVFAYNAHRLHVHYNWADTTANNAYGYIVYGTGDYYGCEWVGNTGLNVGRMGVELWKDSTGSLIEPLLDGNLMEMVVAPANAHDNIAYSIVAGRDAIVSRNRARATDDVARYAAFELGVYPVHAIDNRVVGFFESGFVLDSVSYCLLESNRVTDGVRYGYTVQNSGEQVGHRFIKNYVSGFKDVGFYLREGTGIHGGHTLELNTIIHNANAAATAGSWNGIYKYRGAPIPLRIVRNFIVQDEATPTDAAYGINLDPAALGDFADTEIHYNQFFDKATTPVLDPLYSWAPANVADVDLLDNKLVIHNGTRSSGLTW